MSITYTPSTNFGAKDSLPTNDSNKVIRGSEFTTEFTAIQTAFSNAAPAASPTFTGTATIPTADINGGTIDGVTIGGSSAGAITGTNLAYTGTLTGGTGVINIGSGQVYKDVSGNLITGSTTANASDAVTLRQDGTAFVNNAQFSSGNGSVGGTTPSIYSPTAAALAVSNNSAQRFLIAGNGDISFYEDTGTTAKFFWDASAESLGLGTSSVSNKLSIDVTNTNTGTPFDSGGVGVIALQNTSTTANTSTAISNKNPTSDSANSYIQFINEDGGFKSSIAFGTATAGASNFGERMRIDSSGNLLVGLTSGGKFSVSYGGNDTHFGLGANYDNYITAGASGVNIFRNGATERMRIDASGNVGIGTSSPSSFNQRVNAPHLVVGSGSNSAGVTVYSGTAAQGSINFADGTTTTQQYEGGLVYNHTAAYMSFHTNGGAERMRIDSSGNLLVGQTTNALADTGHIFANAGVAYHIRNSAPALVLNRLTSDGNIVEFNKDGSPVGSIGVDSSDDLYINGANNQLKFYINGVSKYEMDDVRIYPATDNALDLGISSLRWDDIFATNGTIQTSDANEKQDIAELDEAERRVAVAAKGLLRKFRWKDSVAEKGDDARIHFGIIAQDLQAAFEAEGLDAGRYAMFIHSTWTDEETGEERSRMGVRYSELLAFIIAAL